MINEQRVTGWLHTLSEPQFGDELRRVLHPARTIQSPEFLHGRNKQLNEIRKAWYSDGRQIFIHGYRGVGKSSLAHTAAFQRQHSGANPIFLACSEGGKFAGIIHDMLESAMPSDPRKIREVFEEKSVIGVRGISAEMRSSIETGRVPEPSSINEAVRLTEFMVAALHPGDLVVIIDEFDLLKDPDEHRRFSDYVKQLGDQHVSIRFIFCGIGDSIDSLFSAHASAHRYFHPVKLDRLGWEPRLEIIDVAAASLGVRIDDTTRFRIAKISDGFPHYVHIICEKLFWLIYERRTDGRATGDLFEESMHAAAETMEPELKRPYETATRKYSNDYEEILWAAADYHQLTRPSHEIYQSYIRIMDEIGKVPLDRTKFNNRMNNLKKKGYGYILTGTRAGWYEYTEKIVRGYARLRAAQRGVELDIEHPLQDRKIRH
jgi:Cdc6-like AAA superfamily ATPase